MGRPRTISDETILAVSREVFLAQGHGASTRDIAQAAGVSEAVLYQRFGTKDELFFAALAPPPPDLDALLGPEEPTEEPRAYLRGALTRMNDYFGEVLPVVLRLMLHPSFDHSKLGRSLATPARLQTGLSKRLAFYAKQKRVRRSVEEATAKLLVSLAHDSALTALMSHGRASKKELEALVDVVWTGIAV